MIHRLAISHKHYRRSLQGVPFLFTFANALCGFLSVLESINDNFFNAAVLIGLAALMDLCDGRLARVLGTSSCLGAELDALCDAISFCFAPVVLLYNFFDYPVLSLYTVVLGFYLCAGLYRLAKFNVLDSSGVADPANFSGLSTPVSAFFLASLVLYAPWFYDNGLAPVMQPFYNSLIVALLACLMISKIPFPTFKTMRFSNLLAVGITMAGILAGVALYYHMPVLWIVLLLYIGGALVRALYYIMQWAVAAARSF